MAKDDEVTFIAPGLQLEIRLSDRTYDSIHEAAENLKARWVVMVDEAEWGGREWGVFDMHRVQKDRVQIVFPEPTKRFPIVAHDAAVMYALMLAGRN